MTQEQRISDLVQIIRAEFNSYQNGTKSVELSDRLSDGGTGTTLLQVTTDRDTAIANAITGILEGVPSQGNTLNKLYNLIQAVSGGGYATLAEVNTLITDLIGAAPATLNTLEELAAAFNNDPNVVAALTTSIAQKANSADVYTKTEADALFLTQNAFTTAIGNPDIDLVALFQTGLL
jgi:hypothetical protein